MQGWLEVEEKELNTELNHLLGIQVWVRDYFNNKDICMKGMVEESLNSNRAFGILLNSEFYDIFMLYVVIINDFCALCVAVFSVLNVGIISQLLRVSKVMELINYELYDIIDENML